MKKTMCEYLSVLSENKLELLEEIILDKYSKFLDLYWLVREYSDNISSLKYKDTKRDVLKIEIGMVGVDIDDVIATLQESADEMSDTIQICREKKKIHIEIEKDESKDLT